MKKFSLLVAIVACALTSNAQLSFTNSNNRLANPSFHSGCAITVVDVNGDGLDDILHMNQGHIVYWEQQVTNGQFIQHSIGDIGNGSAWAMCAADVDGNGIKDMIADGSGGIKLLTANSNGTVYTMTTLPNSGFFLQNATFGDFNNDGYIDLFTCDDDADSHIYGNDGTGVLTEQSWINFDVSGTDDSGNYGSTWSDFDGDGDQDLYIAKCRQFVGNAGDARRWDVLFVNDGNNNFTEDIAGHGLFDNGAQTWTANFSDIDNDGDLDLFRYNYNQQSQLYQNDGSGNFTDISSTSGINTNSTNMMESTMEDFDNDGYVDIFLTGDADELWHNNGDGTFSDWSAQLFNNNTMESFATGDLNHDGFIDIYGGYGVIYTTPTNIDDVVWLNNRNSNHFLTINCIGTISNRDGIGARAKIYGAWGVQVREVKAGESYGTCNSSSMHFGLGAATSVDSVVINWPSGIITHIVNPAVDQFITVKENACVSPDNIVTASGALVFCSGQTLTLTAEPGYTYLWSNGATTQSITVNAGGEYNVKITSSNGCWSTSQTQVVEENPDATPTVTATGGTVFCLGESVQLISSASSSYQWSDGSTSQSTTVTQTGDYTVTVPGLCQSWSSAPIHIEVLAATTPTTTDATIPVPGTATLTATGSDISWYTSQTGGSAIASGNTFNTPFVNGNTTFYAEDHSTFGGGVSNVGMYTHEGSNYSGDLNANYGIIFDVDSACTLKTVKSFTDTYGKRQIELQNYNTGYVYQSKLVNITTDSSVLTLNFNLVPGTNYYLTTNMDTNNVYLGFTGPHLQRSDNNVNYPYNLPGFLSLTGSSAGSGYYYYFYDWKVEMPSETCPSERAPATVYVITGINDPSQNEGWSVYPIPAENILNISCIKPVNEAIHIQLFDMLGKIVLEETISSLKNGEIVQLPLANLAKASYTLRMSGSTTSFTRQVIIE